MPNVALDFLAGTAAAPAHRLQHAICAFERTDLCA
jgi:hypothetical protein